MRRVAHLFASCVAVAASALVAHADTVAVVNFDNLPTGPSTFAAAGPAQTITPLAGVATFSGGAVIGDAVGFPGIIFATAPNVYATANIPGSFVDPSYTNPLTITIDPSLSSDEVSFALFNGLGSPLSYVANAYDGSTLVATQILSNIPGNGDSGFGLVDLKSSDITSVTVGMTADSLVSTGGEWDYAIDTVAFNESVVDAVATPEPSSLVLLGTGILGVAGAARRRFLRS